MYGPKKLYKFSDSDTIREFEGRGLDGVAQLGVGQLRRVHVGRVRVVVQQRLQPGVRARVRVRVWMMVRIFQRVGAVKGGREGRNRECGRGGEGGVGG